MNAEASEPDKISDPAIKVAVKSSTLAIIKLLDAAGADWHQGGWMWVSAHDKIHDRICHEKTSGHPDGELIAWLRGKWESLHPAE